MHLDIRQAQALQEYLQAKGWPKENEPIFSLEIPGNGNRNCTLRVRTHDRTLIVKQAQPYVEKYPQISAPSERAVIEAHFYGKIQEFASIQNFMPALIGVYEKEYILVLEDLGTSSDYTFLYQPQQKLSINEAESLAHFLAMLHQLTWKETLDGTFTNRAMRVLNHEHIFIFPFLENNGFDLIMRRLLGLSQLPLSLSTLDKEELLETAYKKRGC